MKDYRITFEKRGRVKYISHLDLNRCMIRAIRRSELPAWYTEGFHPHLYLMFPLALSLGAESICEVMDFRLTEEVPNDEILSRLNASMPEGLKAISVHEPKYEAQHIGSACYDVTLQGENLSQLWNDFISQEQILTEKKTKKGMKTLDIKPMITIEGMTAENDNFCLSLRLPAGNEGNLNVTVVTDAFQKYAEKPILVTKILRTKIFCQNGEIFS